MKTYYEVLTWTLCQGWINCWRIDSGIEDPEGVPELFDSIESAQAEIDNIFSDYQYDIENGDREADEMPDQDEYRIEIVTDKEKIKKYEAFLAR